MSNIPTVALINESTVVSSDEIAAAAVALQHQVAYHFGPAYELGVKLEVFLPGAAPQSAWQLVILDDSDQAGALGYHETTTLGLPLAKVFAKTDKDYGYNWTITTSHELLEMLADPKIDRAVQVASSTFYSYEVADACEADEYGYSILGVMVSDFVLPSWFNGLGGAPYDFKRHITKPRELLPGGYIGEWTPSTGWTQKTAETGPTPPASRRLRQRREQFS